jgi:hypothetical protein
MKKFTTLEEQFEKVYEKREEFPDTHKKYLNKYFPDEEGDVPDQDENVSIDQIRQERNPNPVDPNNPAYSTKFADELYAQMYPKQKAPTPHMSPADVYDTMNASRGEDEGMEIVDDPHARYLRPDPKLATHWSDEAKELYSGIADGTESKTTFEVDRDQSERLSKMKSPEMHEVIDQALENNLDISNSVWDLMQNKNKKLYTDLQKSIGIGVPNKVSDFELFNILKKHPDHSGRKGLKYKPNAGSYKLKDLRKRIRSTYGADAEDKIKELEGFINQNRRFPQ